MGVNAAAGLASISASSLIVIIVELMKLFFPNVSGRHAALVALLFGELCAFGYHFGFHQYSLIGTVFFGITIGLQASGMYSASVSKVKTENTQAVQEMKKIQAQAFQIHAQAMQKAQIVDLSTLSK